MWLSTSLKSGSWDQLQQSWSLRICREGKTSLLRARHMVLAMGIGCQIPTMPALPGRVCEYTGPLSSSSWLMTVSRINSPVRRCTPPTTNRHRSGKGRLLSSSVLGALVLSTSQNRVYRNIIGSELMRSISGHDIAEDMLDSELSSVTMVQRGTTCLLTHRPGPFHM